MECQRTSHQRLLQAAAAAATFILPELPVDGVVGPVTWQALLSGA